MKQLVECAIDGSGAVIVETDDLESFGVVRATKKPGEMLEEAKHTFEEALHKIHTATERVIVKLRSMSEQPDEVVTEFGFNLSAQFGAVSASASTEANYKVALSK